MTEDPLRLKTKIYKECQRTVAEKLERIHHAYKQAKEALESESKSTAGDKHETGRAMIQLEQEQLGHQLEEAQKLQRMLQRVPYDKRHSSVQSGALVQTTEGFYFVGVGLGSTEIGDVQVFLLAPASPLAQAMLGKKAGESFGFREKFTDIKAVY